MAIYSSVPPPSQQPQPTASSSIGIEAWTVSALQSLNISPSAHSTGVTLSIPLDKSEVDNDAVDPRAAKSAYKSRKEPLRRDSMNRRDALLKGKEGSRRRQRWENDRFLNVPNAQPPLPSDWEVHPTYPVHRVPYYLAPLWDAGVKHRAEEIAAQKKRITNERRGIQEGGKGRVPQELRQKLKKSKGAKTLLQELEKEVRRFVRDFERKEREREGKIESSDTELDSEDEEIVFIGRDKNGHGITMSDEQKEMVEEELERERKVYEGLQDTPGGSFARWLIHNIATYYGLNSRSVTVGQWRQSYVGIKEMKTGRRMSGIQTELPTPLWGMI